MNTIVEVCQSHAGGDIGGKLAYCHLIDGENEEDRITFSELDLRSRTIASFLANRGMRGERVLLLYSPSIEYICSFMGCLYAGAIAVPAFPPTGKRILPRLHSIAKDCGATMALMDTDTLVKSDRFLREDQLLSKVEIFATDTLKTNEMDGAIANLQLPLGEDIAFLQYTSGSTSEPKGVIVTHTNLIENERMIAEAFSHDESTRVVGWLPPYHDMGLIGNILQPLYLGCPYCFMSPTKAMQDPFKWLKAISRFRGTTTGAPNFAYDLCVSKITEEQRDELDLSCLKVAYNGSEPIRSSSIEDFTKSFSRCGFNESAWLPCYGLAEATLLVSGGSELAFRTCDAEALEGNWIAEATDSKRSVKLVGSGEIARIQDLRIIDSETKTELDDGQVGEIWIHGPNISGGYWKNESLNLEIFNNYVEESGPFLRTGDLGFKENGQLYVTGRLKDLIIVRGRNIYPQDVERLVQESHGKMRRDCGAAFSVNVDGEEHLVVVQEVAFPYKRIDFGEALTKIKQSLFSNLEINVDHVILVKPGGVSKTTSGKVQRSKCRRLYIEGSLKGLLLDSNEKPIAEEFSNISIDGGDLLEKWIIDTFSYIKGGGGFFLNMKSVLATLGLDSIQVLEFKHKIEETFRIDIPIEVLYDDFERIEDLYNDLKSRGCCSMLESISNPLDDIDSFSIDLESMDENEMNALYEAMNKSSFGEKK